ncbi:MAG: prepilin-type N-terminal cleavage/methylation domain-containing protein [Silicimonas sp.]|nr:prepilin-type N-terminal cleavage/methylation domain-containing protein [Silicimonas sp.]
MTRLRGLTLLEMLVVLAIFAMASAAALGLMRRAPAVEVSLTERVNTETAQRRLVALRGSVPMQVTAGDLAGPDSCGGGPVLFFADGSVRADRLCPVIEGQDRWFTLDVFTGALKPAS